MENDRLCDPVEEYYEEVYEEYEEVYEEYEEVYEEQECEWSINKGLFIRWSNNLITLSHHKLSLESLLHH